MMNKPEFVELLAERCEVTKKEAAEMYDDVFGTLADVVSDGNEVAIPGLGRVKMTERAARVATNPRTGEKIDVPAKKAPGFKFAKNVKDAVAAL